MGKINDIDMKNWKEYEDIVTDSLWIIDQRDKTGSHKGDYHGNFVPQIPNQLMKRYTKQGDWVVDAFLGSGTTMIEAQRLQRNCIGIDLSKDILDIARERVMSEEDNTVIKEFINGDSRTVDIGDVLQEHNQEQVQLVILHPPYWDIINFSEKDEDLSNSKTLDDFIENFGMVVDNVGRYLEKDRYLAIVIGDKYANGQLVPLQVHTTNMMFNKGYKLKSIVVKNIDETKGKRNQRSLWRYRALQGGFYIFKHEYIMLFKK